MGNLSIKSKHSPVVVKNNEALKFIRASCLTKKGGNQMTTHENNQNSQYQYIKERFKTNLLRGALLKIAKAKRIIPFSNPNQANAFQGEIESTVKLMSDLIARSVDFTVDIEGRSIFINYITRDPAKTAAMMLELAYIFDECTRGGNHE